MARFALLAALAAEGETQQIVENVIEADAWPDGIELTDRHPPHTGIGWTYDRELDQFTAPEPVAPEPVVEPRQITKKALLARFGIPLLTQLKIVAAINPAGPVQEQQLSAQIAVFHDFVMASDYVDLDDELLVDGLIAMQWLGMITAEQHQTIRFAPVNDKERPS